MSKIYFGQMETANYDFQSFGSTEEEALNAMRKVWDEHRANTGATWTFDELVEGGSYYVGVAELGKAYGGYTHYEEVK